MYICRWCQISNIIFNNDSADISYINQGRSTIFIECNFFKQRNFLKVRPLLIQSAWQRSTTGVAKVGLDHCTVPCRVCHNLRNFIGYNSRSDILQMWHILYFSLLHNLKFQIWSLILRFCMYIIYLYAVQLL